MSEIERVISQSCDMINELRDENRRLKESREWQPIDTAPDLGKSYLVWSPKVRCVFLVMPADGEWIHYGSSVDRPLSDLQQPTHWQPVPSPPKGGAE